MDQFKPHAVERYNVIKAAKASKHDDLVGEDSEDDVYDHEF